MLKWEPDGSDIQAVFEGQNPWRASGVVPDVLAPSKERPLARMLWRRLLHGDPPQYPLILGPRRVGKTTTMHQTVRRLLAEGVPRERLWWLRLDHPLLIERTLGELVQSVIDDTGAAPGREVVLFLDEVVYARDWDLWLKTFYDDKWPVRVVATSSATAALRNRRLESGVGRWSEQYLPPYLFSEYLDLVEAAPDVPVAESLGPSMALLGSAGRHEDLGPFRRRLLLVGGFPELLVRDLASDADETDRLLRSQQVLRADSIERAIYKDIPQSFGLDNPMALERLLYVLAGQVAGILSPTKIGSTLGLAQPTFDRYLSFLERAFLVFTLPNYAPSESGVQRRGRKLYFVDGAVRNAALQRGLAPLDNAPELGLLAENLMAANLHALSVRSGTRLFHWRDKHHEIDLVFDHPDHPLAIEVGLSPDHQRAGLVEFAERYPKFRNRCWIVAPGARVVQPERTSSGVGIVPLDLFLVVVGRQAERALELQLG